METKPLPRLRRRDFLTGTAALAGGYALLKGGFAALKGSAGTAPVALGPAHLSARQTAIFTAVALAIVGPAGRREFDRGQWDPAGDFDDLLGRLAPDQRKLIGIGLILFENASLGLRGFTRMDEEGQAAHLATWRTGRLALQRSIWGVLHAGAAVAFSGRESGWSLMGYPGPCLPAGKHPGRPPGQSVAFEWDPDVP
jgi:hypothetical protein